MPGQRREGSVLLGMYVDKTLRAKWQHLARRRAERAAAAGDPAAAGITGYGLLRDYMELEISREETEYGLLPETDPEPRKSVKTGEKERGGKRKTNKKGD